MQKEAIFEQLKQIIYFPKRNNIVELNMIENLQISEKDPYQVLRRLLQ